LSTPTIGLIDICGKATAIVIPAGAILLTLQQVPQTAEPKMIDMAWDERTVSVFACDIRQRAILISVA